VNIIRKHSGIVISNRLFPNLIKITFNNVSNKDLIFPKDEYINSLFDKLENKIIKLNGLIKK